MADDVIFNPVFNPEETSSVAITDIDPGESDSGPETPFPAAMIPVSKERLDAFKSWLDEWLESLIPAHNEKVHEWAAQEVAYRARQQPPKTDPFVGACNDVIPVIAMAVDPIHARLDTGIFKASPVFVLKGLRKSWLKYTDPLEQWIEYYQKNKLQLRKTCLPGLLELTKHGTMILKTVYDVEKYPIKTYNDKWEVIDSTVTRFQGPRVFHISINDLLFPPSHQNIQNCPIVAERQRVSYGQLKIAEKSGKLVNVSKIKEQESTERTTLEYVRQESANHFENSMEKTQLMEVYEIWCDYDINGDDIPERLVCTYHRDTRELLQLRYNWYFHQRKPYTVIPYSVTNGSLYGLGIAEMSLVFQNAQTKWHQMATDNAYLANIRMFIAKRESGIEEVPRLYTGRVFFVDDPKSDFVPFKAADVYNSTLSERQNLFGLAEKRTGVSDYLTGRESPIVGSRATATSTLALIQEGTRRVEEVLENIRNGFAEVMISCIHLWIQYGLDGLDDLVFDEDMAKDLQSFFSSVDQMNVDGAIGIDLSTSDATNNKVAQQQMKMSIIQVMMQYLTQLQQAGSMALQAAQSGQVDLAALTGDVMTAARKMFRDLLVSYEVRNPEEYLPDLEKYLDAALAQIQGGAPGFGAGDPGVGGMQGMGGGQFVPPESASPSPAGIGISGMSI